MDEKRDETELDETELEGDLAIDDETAAQVTGGVTNDLRRPALRRETRREF